MFSWGRPPALPDGMACAGAGFRSRLKRLQTVALDHIEKAVDGKDKGLFARVLGG